MCSGLDAFVHSDTGKCTNDRRLWITISRLPNSMAVTWARTRMRTYGRGTWTCPEYLSRPPRRAFVLRVSGIGGGGYGLRFYILTRVRLTWFPFARGRHRFQPVCLLNTYWYWSGSCMLNVWLRIIFFFSSRGRHRFEPVCLLNTYWYFWYVKCLAKDYFFFRLNFKNETKELILEISVLKSRFEFWKQRCGGLWKGV